ncbi:drug/metabolite transporter (DMT)-like permease [Nonomuraea thailandensis]|uniref:Drug/metabolite transporter (DMT)-like permease n=1 Tax=Nonomuraea thailandensis TaxID=1188745 RepID=A0A9X2GXY0_9ACTN|nr:EamA family transporter [Nonomuraea thailandensis]MCP2362973.1 drug/metabolite transporter (DMT)-like permease [Nonomuraea thailandensis]
MSSNTADSRRTLMVWSALGIVYVVWGSTYLGIRIAIETMPPLFHGSLRFVCAALLLAGFLLVTKGLAPFRMTLKQAGGAALVGLLLLTGGNGMVAVAEQHISSGLAALLVASVPLWLVLLRLAVRDRPAMLTLVGVLVGFGGVAALSLNGGGGESAGTTGIVVILLGSVSWSIGSFLSSRIPMPPNVWTASAVEMLAGGVGLALVGATVGERFDVSAVSGRSWAALVYLVLVGSLVGFTAYTWLLGNAPISLVSTYAYVNPIVAVILGVLVVNEHVTVQIVLGGLVILIGVALVVSTERRARARSAPAPETVAASN